MPTAPSQPRVDDPLRRPRKRAEYTAAERAFSIHLRHRVDDLLQGKRNHLPVLRKYPNNPQRLGVLTSPDGLVRSDLRLEVVEQLAWDAITEVGAGEAPGGPIAQIVGPDGAIVESQTFPTRFPHIVVERTDRFAAEADGDEEPVEITWCLHRVQNQRAQTQINRLLDAANLAFELVRMVF